VVTLIYVSAEIQEQAHDGKTCLDAVVKVYSNPERRFAAGQASMNSRCIRICAAFEE